MAAGNACPVIFFILGWLSLRLASKLKRCESLVWEIGDGSRYSAHSHQCSDWAHPGALTSTVEITDIPTRSGFAIF